MDYLDFALKIGEAESVEPELLFPEDFPDFDENEEIVNPEEAQDAGFFDRHSWNLRVPYFMAYPAEGENRTDIGVVICPGGGYQCLAYDKEGTDIARFLNSCGISAFVVNYRMPKPEDGDNQKYGPLRDAQRALRLVRSRAEQYGVDPAKVGIMGFSAGAHVAVTASTLFKDVDEKNPALSGISARPDFSILIYPVISLKPEFGHAGSREALLGLQAGEDVLNYFSGELQVTPETPPAILIQTNDDVVPVENSLMYYKAMRKAGVPVTMHLFAAGGHGYGMRSPVSPLNHWPELVRDWLLSL